MAADNLSNLFPHPFYVWFHYSHPPLAERIALLENQSKSLFLSAHSSRPGLTPSI
jgi:Zn-dependent protease with chaperone function